LRELFFTFLYSLFTNLFTFHFSPYTVTMAEDNEREEARRELAILLKDFRSRFSVGTGSPQAPSAGDNGFNISLSAYQEPPISPEMQDKINTLLTIAQSIEEKIATEEAGPDKKVFKINYRKSLNASQHLAVTTINGPLLVIAGAGTGKTRTIIYRVAYLLENEIPPEKILLLTFTRKASNEMINRVSTLLNDINCGNIMAGTFHSFANYALRRYYKILNILPNFTIVDTTDSEDILDLIRQELKMEKKNKAFPRKSRIQTIISKARNCNLDIGKVIENEYKGLNGFTEDIEVIFQAYTEYKKANNIFDYDDLLEFLRDSLKNNLLFRERIQESFRYIMVDEFQDTNIVQKEIIDLIAEKYKNVMVVGDDSQSIYAFRGADVENILRFPETYPDCRVIKIEQNYRSKQDILNFSNAIIHNARIGYKKNLYSTNNNEGKPVIKKFYSQEDEAAFIVSKILELREQNLPLNQVAVLYRSSFHGNFIQAELLRRNIPYLVFGGIKFTERRHVKDIIAYLRIVFNPLDAVSWNRVLKLIPGIGAATASKIVRQIHEQQGQIDFNSFTGKFAPELKELNTALAKAGREDITIAEKVEMLKEYYAPILKNIEDDYNIRLLDVDVLYTLACKYEKLEKFLSDFALDPPSNRYQNKTAPLVDESEDKPVTLSTIHSAKGLEWNTVFVPHLLDGLLPGAGTLGKIEELEEERRLFYVACTRAKERLFLTMPAHVASWDAFFTRPSRFLIEVEKDKYTLLR
jgi:DNA helicase-2/ATP-dependent DNA helicase PcrA